MKKLDENATNCMIIEKVNEIIDFLHEKYGMNGENFVDVNKNVKEYFDRTGGMML